MFIFKMIKRLFESKEERALRNQRAGWDWAKSMMNENKAKLAWKQVEDSIAFEAERHPFDTGALKALHSEPRP